MGLRPSELIDPSSLISFALLQQISSFGNYIHFSSSVFKICSSENSEHNFSFVQYFLALKDIDFSGRGFIFNMNIGKGLKIILFSDIIWFINPLNAVHIKCVNMGRLIWLCGEGK